MEFVIELRSGDKRFCNCDYFDIEDTIAVIKKEWNRLEKISLYLCNTGVKVPPEILELMLQDPVDTRLKFSNVFLGGYVKSFLEIMSMDNCYFNSYCFDIHVGDFLFKDCFISVCNLKKHSKKHVESLFVSIGMILGF